MVKPRNIVALALAGGLMGCVSTSPDDVVTPAFEAEQTTPAYAPDDPCKGVVPQLCPYPADQAAYPADQATAVDDTAF